MFAYLMLFASFLYFAWALRNLYRIETVRAEKREKQARLVEARRRLVLCLAEQEYTRKATRN